MGCELCFGRAEGGPECSNYSATDNFQLTRDDQREKNVNVEVCIQMP